MAAQGNHCNKYNIYIYIYIYTLAKDLNRWANISQLTHWTKCFTSSNELDSWHVSSCFGTQENTEEFMTSNLQHSWLSWVSLTPKHRFSHWNSLWVPPTSLNQPHQEWTNLSMSHAHPNQLLPSGEIPSLAQTNKKTKFGVCNFFLLQKKSRMFSNKFLPGMAWLFSIFVVISITITPSKIWLPNPQLRGNDIASGSWTNTGSVEDFPSLNCWWQSTLANEPLNNNLQ